MWYRVKVNIKLWPDMATSPEAPDHNASELCRTTVLQQGVRHFHRNFSLSRSVRAELSTQCLREDTMPAAAVATVQNLSFPRIAKSSGSTQGTFSLPMAHTVGGWVETMDSGAMTAGGASVFPLDTPAGVPHEETEPRRLYDGMAALLRAAGEHAVDAGEGNTHRLLLQEGQLCVECVPAPASRTMSQIFEGHHRIAEAMRSRGCEGRWQIWINRHYLDDEPVEEVLDCMKALSAHDAAAGVLPSCPKGVGVAVSRYQPSTAERVHRRSVLPLYDTYTQRPKSLIMSGGLSLHIEGPFFHRYEPMEALLNSTARSRTTIIAVESDDTGEATDNGAQMQMLLDRAPAAIGGIIVLQPESGRRGAATLAGVYTRRGLSLPLLDLLARRVQK